MQILNNLIAAFATYSRLPMPGVEWNEENRRYALCFFPLVGAVIGAAEALWLWLSAALEAGPFLRGAVGAALPLIITGGIHMDGFMDVSDALASWQPRERKLEILRDSHTGAFAVMKCALYLLVGAALWSEAGLGLAPSLACVFVASRALSAWTSVTLRGAREEGMLNGFAKAAQKRAVNASAIVCALVCAGVWVAQLGTVGALCLDAAALLVVWYRRLAYKHFGGVTGDLAGWFTQVSEMCLMALIILGGKVR